MYTTSTLLTLVSLTLAAVNALVIDTRATACNATSVAWVEQQISNPIYFCTWYLSDGRTRSPLAGLSVLELEETCACITVASAVQTLTTVTTAPSSSVCGASDIAVITDEYETPGRFCKFWNSYPRTDSPIPGKSVTEVYQGCKCYSASTSSTSTTSTSSISTTKPSTTSAQPSTIIISVHRSTTTASVQTSTTMSIQSSTFTTSVQTSTSTTSAQRSTSTTPSQKSTSTTTTWITSTITEAASTITSTMAAATTQA